MPTINTSKTCEQCYHSDLAKDMFGDTPDPDRLLCTNPHSDDVWCDEARTGRGDCGPTARRFIPNCP